MFFCTDETTPQIVITQSEYQFVYAAHNAQNVVINCIHADLGGGGSRNSWAGEHQLENGVVNAREVAGARGLVFLRAEGKGIHVDSSVGVASVVLEGLHDVEVGSLTLREAVLAVELELGGDHGVLTPAVEVKGGLSKHEGAGIRHAGSIGDSTGRVGEGIGVGGTTPLGSGGGGVGGDLVNGASHLEKTRCVDEGG